MSFGGPHGGFRTSQGTTASASVGGSGGSQGFRTNQGTFPTTGVVSSNNGFGSTTTGNGQVVGVRIRVTGTGGQQQGNSFQGSQSHNFVSQPNNSNFQSGNTAGASVTNPTWLRFNVGGGQQNTGAGSVSGFSHGGNTAAASVSTSSPSWLRFNIGPSSSGSVGAASVGGHSSGGKNTAAASVSTPSWLRFNVGGGQPSGSGNVGAASVGGYSQGGSTASASVTPSWLRFNVGGGQASGSSSAQVGAGSIAGPSNGFRTSTSNSGGGFFNNLVGGVGIRLGFTPVSSPSTASASIQDSTTRCNVRGSGCGAGTVSFQNSGQRNNGGSKTESGFHSHRHSHGGFSGNKKGGYRS